MNVIFINTKDNITTFPDYIISYEKNFILIEKRFQMLDLWEIIFFFDSRN